MWLQLLLVRRMCLRLSRQTVTPPQAAAVKAVRLAVPSPAAATAAVAAMVTGAALTALQTAAAAAVMAAVLLAATAQMPVPVLRSLSAVAATLTAVLQQAQMVQPLQGLTVRPTQQALLIRVLLLLLLLLLLTAGLV
jgi:hypothetical protein